MIVIRILLLLISAFVHNTFECELQGANVVTDDLFGASVGVSGNTIVVGAPLADSDATSINGDSENNNLQNAGAAYTFIKTEDGWIQEAYLKPSNADRSDQFGYSVAIDKDTIVVGARYQDYVEDVQTGAVYVFVRKDGTWSEEAFLRASNGDDQDAFGFAVSISDDAFVVGAPYEASNGEGEENNELLGAGAAYVFERSGTEWKQVAYLKGSAPASNNRFGMSVSISGNRIVIGTAQVNQAFVFVKNDVEDRWDLEQTLTPPAPALSVSILGDTIALGVPTQNSNEGAVHIYVRNEVTGVWDFTKELTIANTIFLGDAVSLSNDALLAGASGESSGGSGWNGCDSGITGPSQSGSAYVFERTLWEESACIKATTPAAGAYFGRILDSDDGTYVIGQAENSDFATAFVYHASPDEAICLPPPHLTTGTTGTTATTATTGTTGTTATTGTTGTTGTTATTGTTGTTGSTTGTGCEVIEFNGEEFVPRTLSLSESSCILIESFAEVCVNCINIRHHSESYFLTTATFHTLPRGIYGCVRTSCAKRSLEDSSEDSQSWSSYFSIKSMKPVSSNHPSKWSSKSLSSDNSRSSSDSSDSSSDWFNLNSFELVLFVGGDTQKHNIVNVPSTSTTQSTSNRNFIGVIVRGLGLLVLSVALFSYWKKRNSTDERSHLLTHNRYHTFDNSIKETSF